LYFAASEAATGRELHRTDGTVAGTSLVRDINPGTTSGFYGSSAALANELFFMGDDGVHGKELWKSNGLTSETVMVKDVNPGLGDGFVLPPFFSGVVTESYFATANKFYFTGYTPATGNEPWTSDGSEGGTVMLEDITPGADGQGFIFYKIYDQAVLYFIVKPPYEVWDNDDAYADLWRTQGSPLSTTKIRTLDYASSTFDDPARSLGNKILFFSRGGDGGPHILWVSDGTSGGTQTIFNLQDYVGSHFLPFADNCQRPSAFLW
jgi:ELWxxDGT repeat protein